VAAERNLQRDASSVSARVRRDGQGFRATVELFDAFTDGSPVVLQLELSPHAFPRGTELFGAASPAPAEAAIWKQLHALADQWRAVRPVPVVLNHLYTVVDRETYALLAASKFLRSEFAVSEERKTVRGDLSYSGLYFYGGRTYFEFLPPEAAPGFAVGGTGIGLGVDAPGGNTQLERRLQASGLSSLRAPVTRQLDGQQLPWFDMLALTGLGSRFNAFVMEYDARFLRNWYGTLAPQAGGVRRAEVLERYAAALGSLEQRDRGAFRDIRRLELALPSAECATFATYLSTAGWAIEAPSATEGPWLCIGPECEIAMLSSPAASGIRSFEVELTRELKLAPLSLGRVVVTFAGKRARFQLAP
jgi:hypothetical protein